MKCKLCGSDIKNGVCVFCGQPLSYSQSQELEKMEKLLQDEMEEESEKEPDGYQYSEHYERRYIHSELKGASSSISSLMVKILIIILSMMMIFAMYTYKQNKDAASNQEITLEENVDAASDQKITYVENISSDLQEGKKYTISCVLVNPKTGEPCTEKIEYTFTATEENQKLVLW